MRMLKPARRTPTAVPPSVPYRDGTEAALSMCLPMPRATVSTSPRAKSFLPITAVTTSAADSLSVVAQPPVPEPAGLGANLVLNVDAEAGPAADALLVAPDVPGWARTSIFTVDFYDDKDGATCYNNACGTAGVTNPGKNF